MLNRGMKIMTIDTENLINSIMASFDRIKFINSEDIPNIDLYMDQVTTFMDNNLSNTVRNKEVDKVLTKTMINNYAKNDLLPPPVKKKYSKEHVLVLIFIYYFKNILSINDIQSVLSPLTDKFFNSRTGFSIIDIYDEVTDINMYQIEEMKKDIQEKYKKSSKTFENVSEDDKEFLQMFSMICSLVFDVYVKKILIEKIIDDYVEKKTNKEDDTKNKKSKNKETKKRS